MKRVGIGGIFHETNTYAARTQLDDFAVLRAEQILTFSQGARTYLGGLIDESRAQGYAVVPLLYAEATPSGLISHAAYLALREELVAAIAASDLDGVLLSLHGAGVAEGVDSIEEDICAAVRERAGADFPVVVTLDLHGNITQRLGDLCNGLFPVRFNPHTDQHERGVEAVRCLAQWFGGARFETVVVQVPVLFPPVPTSHPVLAELDQRCQEMERDDNVLCVRLMHGFPYVDAPHIGASVVAVVRRGRADAHKLASLIGSALWQARETITVPCADASDAVAQAQGEATGFVVINEFSDNTGAGCPGDGTYLLAALIAAGTPACFAHIHDPETVRQAAAAGVGAHIHVVLGGKKSPLSGDPIRSEAQVLALGSGAFLVKSPMGTGEAIDLGLLATLRIGQVDIVVSNGRRQTLDDGPFIKAGIDIQQFPVVALKSSQHFRAWFESRAARVITCDSPGLSPVDVSRLMRNRLQRPLWPLSTRAQFSYPSTQVAQ